MYALHLTEPTQLSEVMSTSWLLHWAQGPLSSTQGSYPYKRQAQPHFKGMQTYKHSRNTLSVRTIHSPSYTNFTIGGGFLELPPRAAYMHLPYRNNQDQCALALLPACFTQKQLFKERACFAPSLKTWDLLTWHISHLVLRSMQFAALQWVGLDKILNWVLETYRCWLNMWFSEWI